MLTFAAQIVLVLLILGGAIAYIGNYVGRYIGKRRLTIFHLRPRHTAIAITIVSGTLIALSTMAVILVVSQDARTALLGLDQLKKEISGKTRELEAANFVLKEKLQQAKDLEQKLALAKKEISVLQRTREKLDQEIKVAREGQVLFKVGEVITLSLIQAGPEKQKLEQGLQQILSAAEIYVRGFGVKGEESIIYASPEELNQTVYFLSEQRKIYVVKLIASRNVLWGERIPVRLELAENKLIYSAEQEIADLDIAKGLSAAEVEQEIVKLLKTLHGSAREAGVLPDPSGSMGSIPYSEIFDLAKKIKSSNRNVNLKVLASRDIYTMGPLAVKFKVSNR